MPRQVIGAIQPRRRVPPCVAPLGNTNLAVYNPLLLFAAGEVGVWFDPSDLSTMFQDSAGTTPAAIDQAVGLILDKSGRGNHASQTTLASRPILRQDNSGRYYLDFDGIDDSLFTASINFALPHATIFMGVAKRSGATGVIIELSATFATNAGSFVISSSGIAADDLSLSCNATFTFGGTRTGYQATSYPAPKALTVMCAFDMSKTSRQEVVTPRINNTTPTLNGTFDSAITPANFGNYPINLGRRNNATLPFNGGMYSIIVRGAFTSVLERQDVEQWVNQKTGAY
jgi:hypothetical protein